LEQKWTIMQRRVYQRQIHSVDELKRRLIDVWLLTSGEENFKRIGMFVQRMTLRVQLVNWQCWFLSISVTNCPYLLQKNRLGQFIQKITNFDQTSHPEVACLIKICNFLYKLAQAIFFYKIWLGEGVPGPHPHAKFHRSALKNMGLQSQKSRKIAIFGTHLPLTENLWGPQKKLNIGAQLRTFLCNDTTIVFKNIILFRLQPTCDTWSPYLAWW